MLRRSVVVPLLSLFVLASPAEAQRKKLRSPFKIAKQRAQRMIKMKRTRATLGSAERRTLRGMTSKQPALAAHQRLTARVNGGVIPNFKKGRILALEWAARPDVKNGHLQPRSNVRSQFQPKSRKARLIAQLDRMNDVLWSSKVKGSEPMGEGFNSAGDAGVWRQVLRTRRWVNLAINQLNSGDYAAAHKSYKQARREMTVYKAKSRTGTLDLKLPLRLIDSYTGLWFE